MKILAFVLFVPAALAALPASAALDFRARTAGHVFRCGSRILDLGKDGPATLSDPSDPTVIGAQQTTWSPHGVTLNFGKSGGTVRLFEFGTTVTAKAADGSAVCVNVR